MSTFEHLPEHAGNGTSAPLIGGLLTVHNLWQAQLPALECSGVLAQAVSWAERDEQLWIDIARSHVFVEVAPQKMPWGGEVPDGCIALNGLMLSGIGRQAGRHAKPARELIPVHIGIYFADESNPKSGPLAFGQGDLTDPLQTTVGGFEEEFGAVIHEQALTVQLETMLGELPLNQQLSLPPRLMDLAFASPSSPL